MGIESDAHLLGLDAAVGQQGENAVIVVDGDRLLQIEHQEVLPPVGIGHIGGAHAFVGSVDARLRGIVHHTGFHREKVARVVFIDFQRSRRSILKIGQQGGLGAE